MLLKVIILLASACFVALFFGGFLDAGPTEIVKKILFGGASTIMILIAFGVIFVDKQPKNRRINMTNRTECADEIFWTVILFVITTVCYFLAWIFLTNGKMGFGYFMTTIALAETIVTLAGIYIILMRRWAERKEV